MQSRACIALLVSGFYLAISALLAPHIQAQEDEIAEGLEAVNTQLLARPNDPQLYIQRARLLVLGNRHDQAIRDLDQANRLKPLPEIDREKAQVYYSAGWYETGLEHAN